jgi:hypothetical protein
LPHLKKAVEMRGEEVDRQWLEDCQHQLQPPKPEAKVAIPPITPPKKRKTNGKRLSKIPLLLGIPIIAGAIFMLSRFREQQFAIVFPLIILLAVMWIISKMIK